MMENYLPIIDVNEDNFNEMYPTIIHAIETASFVAIDCELTGLGHRGLLNCPEIDLRYQHTAEIARNYAIISFGLSCFTRGRDDADVQSDNYNVQTFDVLTLCKEPFTVASEAHKFLITHGFDFNKLYIKGVPYYKGCDKKEKEEPNVRDLFSTLVKCQKPIVIHNGLVDIAFLYQSFYADLPKKADTLAADLSDMFPHGIYDTKYIAEFHQTNPATYLGYLYNKMQLDNDDCRTRGNHHVEIHFTSYEKDQPHVDWYPYLLIHSYNTEEDDDGLHMCSTFAFHGWCPKGERCAASHDINKIVKLFQFRKAKRRGNSKCSGPKSASLVEIIKVAAKMKKRKATQDDTSTKKQKLSSKELSTNELSDKSLSSKTKYPKDVMPGGSSHRAGFDAFMTGYIFAFHVSQIGELRQNYHYDSPFTSERIGLTDQVNKVYLVGKNIPFLIRTGTYAIMSANHLKKIEKLREPKVEETSSY